MTITKDNVKQRSSGIELFRIILILAIIAHHYIVNSEIPSLYDWSAVNGNMVFAQCFGMFGKMAINGFTLITGYFMINSNITLKKFFKTYIQAKVYYMVFYFIFLMTGYIEFDLDYFIKQVVFSFIYEAGFRYIGTYLVFFLFIPYLNILIRGCSKKQLQALIGLLLCYFTLIPTFWGKDTFIFLAQFFVMYVIGSYIALYPSRVFEKRTVVASVFVLSIVMAILWVLKVDYIDALNGKHAYYGLMSDSNKILAVIMAISGFLLFKTIKIKCNTVINRIAASTFGVLCIHANSDAMRNFLWVDILKNKEWYNSRFFVVHAILSVLGVYIVCLAIDQVRVEIVKFLNLCLSRKREK